MTAFGMGKVTVTIIFLGLILFFFSGLILYHKDIIKLPMISMEKRGTGQNYLKKVSVSIMTNMSTDNRLLKIDIAIPCRSQDQHDDVMKNVRAIRSDFLLKIDQRNIEERLRDRDFDSIKAAFRDIVNEHVEHPVDTIY